MGLCVKKGWLTCRAASAAAAAASGPRGWGLWGASRVEEVATCGVHIVVTNGQARRVVLAGGGLVADIVGVGSLVAEEAPRLGLATGRRPGGGRQVDSLPGWRRRRPMRRLRWATTVGVRHRRRLKGLRVGATHPLHGAHSPLPLLAGGRQLGHLLQQAVREAAGRLCWRERAGRARGVSRGTRRKSPGRPSPPRTVRVVADRRSATQVASGCVVHAGRLLGGVVGALRG